MKTPSRLIRVAISAIAILTAVPLVRAGTDTWTGAGGSQNLFWLSPINWNPAGVPQTGDDLVFTNTIGLVNSNNIPGGNFNSITFATPSGAFILNGQSVTVNNINDLQVTTPETINLPIADSANLNVNVVGSGILNLNNIISGTGNLTNSGAGTLNLNGSNTFSGSLVVNAGTVVVGKETNFPAPPLSPTVGNIVLNGGALQTTANFGLNTNRGIALGPISGSGVGTLNVASGTTLTNDSIMANNGGGTGGLTKVGFGNLQLYGANTYTGPTTNTIGFLILDFTKPVSPANDIINSASTLSMGSGNSGLTSVNFAELLMAGKVGSANSQTFSGANFVKGASVIIATNGGGGTATLALGALSHSPGGAVKFVTSSQSGGGNITTSSGNVGGILGGWATMSGDASTPSLPANNLITGTNWACVDINGNIVNFNNFYVYDAANHNTLHAAVDANTTGVETNIFVGDAAGDIIVATNDIDNAGTTTDINSIKLFNSKNGTGVYIGLGNTLRLGQYGGILSVQTANVTPVVGGVSNMVNGISASQAPFGSQDAGTLTAGGADNTPGEIVITHSTTSETSGGLIIAARIADNGSGPVTVVKMGPGSIKLDGNNTYSGGLYMLEGRVQWQGAEIFGTGNGGPGGTNGLNDGGGTGPVYVFPGAYFGPNLSIPNITNDFFVAGVGDAQENFGVFRGGNFGGNITMIGDAALPGDPANIFGSIHGPFNLTIGAPGRKGPLSLANSGDDWTGNTFMFGRSDNNSLTLSNNEVIPNGFGKGNVIMTNSAAASKFVWDMNGFSETVNGLLTSPNFASTLLITSSNGAASTLTIGDNDQGGVFGGIISNTIALTKIGAGVETLTNLNFYTNATTVSNGVLQLTGVGSINNSTNVNIEGGTFDVSGLNYAIPGSQAINISGGTFFIGSASAGGSVSLTNGTLKVTTLNSGLIPNLAGNTINLGSGPNLVQVVNVPLIDVYPKPFVIASYNTLNGDATTLAASLPAGGFPAYGGYVTNDSGDKEILLVMTNGPITPSLTWAGFNFNTHTVDGNWNFVDPDWTNKPAHTTPSYTDGSLLTFDDSAMTGVVNLTTTFTPAGVTVTNGGVNYTFMGSGAIYGTNGFDKEGTGKLTLDNTGGDSYNGLSIGIGGIVQMGINDNGGSLGTNNVGNNGTLVFNRVNSTLLISNSISGSGGILVSNAASTTTLLGGNDSGYNGSVYVVPNMTLAPANANALSSTNGTLTIPTGTTLDVSGQGIAANSLVVGKVVSVSGAGVDGTSGAIVNNVATNQQNALLRVTLTGDTTFGGSGSRWDIRGTPAQHGALNGAYNITKKGAYFMSIANVDVDPALNNVDVQAGTLELNGATTLGTSGTLTIEDNAVLQLFSMSNAVSKTITFGNSSLTNANGNNTITGPMTLNGALAVGGNAHSTLTLNNSITGTGSLTKNMTNTLVLTGPNDTYSGATTVNDGTLLINGLDSGSTLTENVSATTPVNVSIVGGNGTNAAPVDIEDTLWPGVGGAPSTFGAGDGTSYNGDGGGLVLGYTGGGLPRAEFSLNTGTTAGGGVNDLVTVNGDFNGNFGHVVINPLTPLTVGSPYTLVTYTGSKLNNFSGAIGVVDALQPSRYAFTPTYDTANKKVLLTVTTGAGNLVWNNAASTGLWTTNAADANWLNTGTSANDQFYQLDAVTFNDSIGAGVTTINIATTNLIPGTVTVSNTAVNYTFTGAGSIGGAANLIKQGTGTLTISNANTFTGTVTVQGGTVAANVNNALGSSALIVYGGTAQANGANLSLVSTLITNGTVLINNTNGLGGVTAPVYVTNSGTLDIGGASFGVNLTPLMGSKPIYISGWGVNSNGCLINSGTNQQDAFQNVIMTGDAAIGGNGGLIAGVNGGRFDLGRLTNNPTLSTGGNPYNLYKVGSNQVSLVNLAVDSSLNNIDIRGGELGIETGTTLGNPAGTLTIESGANLEFFEATNSVSKTVIVNGGGPAQGNYPNIWFNGGGVPNNSISGLVIVTNGEVVIGGAVAGTISNTITGPSSLRIAGAVHFDGTDTYTGNTIVSNNGTLFLDGNASINNSTNINIVGGTVNVAGRANNTLTLVASSSQTLSGVGTVAGTLTVPSGTTVTVGTNAALGQLTVTTNVNLSGTLNMGINKTGATNNVLVVGGQVNYGGTLNLNNLSGTLAANDSFKLFNAGTYGATPFASITPAHPNNDVSLNWDTSLLTVSGTLKVVSAITPTPHITTISLSGTTLNLMATNGSPGGTWTLLQSTNVALPLAQWDTNRIGTFDGSGNLTTNIVNVATNNQEFYILKQ